jgi:hypothetical protein
VTGPYDFDAIGAASRRAALLTAIGGVAIVGSLVYSAYSVNRASTRVDRLNATAESLAVVIAQRESTLFRLTPLAAKGLGYAAPDSARPSETLIQGVAASHAADSLMKLNRAERAGVVLRYYPRQFETAVNADIVLPVLRRAGFTLDERQTAPGMSDVETNAVWFGADVNPDDARLVALVLTSAGVRLRAIRPFDDATGPKRRAIEVGADRAEIRSPAWTADRILSTRTFARKVSPPERIRIP